MYYITPVFRYEKPQAGRLREHHQFGVELYGSSDAKMDAEAIAIAKYFLNSCGVKNLTLNINSIGCQNCKPDYNQALKAYYLNNHDKLCPTCQDRLDKNPLRILDCKDPGCSEINRNAPSVLDYLCADCKSHFEKLKRILKDFDIDFCINPKIVRGLDYYTKTVFEFVSNDIGAQGTVCGGGRYDNLVSYVGGNPTPACGFGLGLERLLLVMQNLGVSIEDLSNPQVFIAYIGDQAEDVAFQLANQLRLNGIHTDIELLNRSLKAQFKYANKIQADYVIVVAEDEIKNQVYTIKDMRTAQEEKLDFTALLKKLILENQKR